MSGARINKLGKSKLLDPAQTLELNTIDQIPNQPIKILCRRKNNQPVDRVADSFLLVTHML
jgi:hypothetical protein